MSTQVDLDTSKGTIRVELDEAKAPATCRNFLEYVDAGHYDGTVFHRGHSGLHGPGRWLRARHAAESHPGDDPERSQQRLEECPLLARDGAHLGTAFGQFAVLHQRHRQHLSQLHAESPSGWGYAVFAKVVSGQEVVDAIEKVKTGSKGGHGDVPVEDVTIVKATRVA